MVADWDRLGFLRPWLAQIWMGIDKCPETCVVLGVGALPREATKDHTEENNGHAPYVRLPGIIFILVQHLGGKIGITTHDTLGFGMCSLAGIVEDSRSAKIDDLDYVVGGHDTIVELEVTMCQTEGVEIFDAVAYLTEDAVDFGTTHLSRHDD